MGKNDFLTPKAIGNRIKAKGLQKLRWYCQLCQKQCRDENGFKCHQLSDSHRRQMEIFGQNPERIVEGYSEEFEACFMEHLRRAHPFSRVSAKNVYNEYINDRTHIHMNSTKWLTLTDFVKYLGKTGQCKVEETPKGWFITLVQKDPAKELEEESKRKRSEMEREEEDRHMIMLQEQIERAKRARREQGLDSEGDEDEEDEEAHELKRDETEGPLTLSLAPAAAGTSVASTSRGALAAGGVAFGRSQLSRPAAAAFGDEEDDDNGGAGGGNRGGPAGPSGKRSKLDELMQSELRKKQQAQQEQQQQAQAQQPAARHDAWLFRGIIVKVMAKELTKHGYYKQKGIVGRVVDKYVGEVEMLQGGDVVRVDQAQLETVIPSPGGTVMVVNGMYRGFTATLLGIDTDKYQGQVRLLEGPYKGKEAWLDYEAICKLHSDE